MYWALHNTEIAFKNMKNLHSTVRYAVFEVPSYGLKCTVYYAVFEIQLLGFIAGNEKSSMVIVVPNGSAITIASWQ